MKGSNLIPLEFTAKYIMYHFIIINPNLFYASQFIRINEYNNINNKFNFIMNKGKIRVNHTDIIYNIE